MKETMIDEVGKAEDGLSEAGTTDAAGASLTEPGDSGFIMKSGSTTFLVGLHFSETSKDTLSDKVKKLAKKDVEDGNF